MFQRVIDCAEDLTERNIAIQFIKQICQGCSYLSLKKIVHLDIKPENVVCADGSKDCLVKVHVPTYLLHSRIEILKKSRQKKNL